MVTRTVAKAPGGIPVTASEGPVSAGMFGPHHTVEGSLEAWEEAGGLSLYVPGRCAGQGGVTSRRRRHFLLEEAEEDIAAAGALRLRPELHLEGAGGWGEDEQQAQERAFVGHLTPGSHKAVADYCGLDTMATERSAAPVWGAEASTPPLLSVGDHYPAEGVPSRGPARTCRRGR